MKGIVIYSFFVLINCFSDGLYAQVNHPDSATPKKIAVIVDERTELITTMQLLFEYPLVGRAEIKYKDDVQKYFSKHKGDTSVNYFLGIAEKYLSFIRPINYAYHFTFPGLKQNAEFTPYENNNLGFAAHSSDSLKLYLNALKQFYKDSQFHAFYQEHQMFYDSLVNKVKKTVDSVDLAGILEKHYGTAQHSYTLVLSPLFLDAGMSTWIKRNNGNDLYSIIGPDADSKVTPNFDTRWLMQFLVIHEFSHPFCNPLIDRYYSSLAKDSCLWLPIKKQMVREGNGTWKTVLYELLTRANEIGLVREIYGKADADKIYNDYIKKNYIYLEGLVPIIDEYNSNRDKYKTLDNIMPKVVDYFDAAAKNYR